MGQAFLHSKIYLIGIGIDSDSDPDFDLDCGQSPPSKHDIILRDTNASNRLRRVVAAQQCEPERFGNDKGGPDDQVRVKL